MLWIRGPNLAVPPLELGADFVGRLGRLAGLNI